MAKKVVATLKKAGGNKHYTKCIKMTKSEKTGSYQFKEDMVSAEMINEFFKK